MEHDGKFYDPSYGIGPIVGQFTYEQAGWKVETLGGSGSTHSSLGTAGAEDGSISFAFSNSESATVWLSYQSTKGGEAQFVSHRYRSGFFGASHFVKGDQSTLAITSVADVEGFSGPVQFSRGTDGENGEYRAFPAPKEGELLDARLVRAGGNYWLSSRFLGSREGSRTSGALFCSELDSDFRGVHPAKRCLGNIEVVDFEADVDGARVVLFAITRSGYVLSEGPEFAATNETAAGHLSSASVVIGGKTIRLAAIEAVGTPDEKVLIGAVGGGTKDTDRWAPEDGGSAVAQKSFPINCCNPAR